MANLLIDGVKSDPLKLVHPMMGLSSARADMKRHTFQLTIDKDSLLLDFTSRYEEWVKDSKDEDEKSGGPDSDDEIGMAGYPKLKEVLQDKGLVESLFGLYFVEDVFEKYCCSNYENIDYWYDDIEGADVSEQSITLYGTCYSNK